MTVKEEFFYVEDGVVASTDPGWLQLAFNMLTGIFDWVGLRTNVQNNVGMVIRPCRMDMVQEDKAYTRRTTGEGSISKEGDKERVLCPE